MNNPTTVPPVFRNALTFAVLAFIAADLAMMTIAIARYRALFLQPGSPSLVVEPVLALLAYAVAVIYIARNRRQNWDIILRNAAVFGLISGCLDLVNIGIENGLPFPIHGAVQQIGFMLAMFVVWGIAGFRASNSLHSVPRGLWPPFAAPASA